MRCGIVSIAACAGNRAAGDNENRDKFGAHRRAGRFASARVTAVLANLG
jgi:hypothetical protein